MWKDPDGTRQLEGYKNIVYNYKGNVYCYCLESGEEREMGVGGFGAENLLTISKSINSAN